MLTMPYLVWSASIDSIMVYDVPEDLEVFLVVDYYCIWQVAS
jgi:hypothetical protein